MLRLKFARPTALAAAIAVWLCPHPCPADPQTAPATQPAGPAVVYTCDFEKGASPEWSSAKTETSPEGGRKYLGQFANESVALTVRRLPPHQLVQVSFDLFVIRNWYGSHPKWGPNVWELAVAGGPTLLRTTFSNADFYAGCRQAFPDWVGIADSPPRTGAAERNSLGYVYTGPPEIQPRVLDSVYRLNLTFPHAGADITLKFSASGLEKETAQTWGLDNVSVSVLSAVSSIDDEAMKGLWEELASEDSQRASEAARRLIASGEQAVEFLAPRVAPVIADARQVALLLRQLDDADWKVREKAAATLTEMGKAVEKQLKDALAKLPKDGSLELRLRLERVIQKVGEKTISDADRMLYLRAARVLGAIDSPKARKLLEGLAVEALAPPEKKKEEPPKEEPPVMPVWGGR